MKKAKIMLMTIAIFGVIGGALAFKATKFGGPLWLCTTTSIGGSNVCTDGYTTTRFGIFTTAYTATTTLSAAGTCFCPVHSFYCKTAASILTQVIAAAGE